MINPITFIKHDHRHIKELFSDYDALEEADLETKEDLALEIAEGLRIHMEMEEELVYPCLNTETTEHAYEEHERVKKIVTIIETMLPSEASEYDAPVYKLRSEIEHHIKEEEATLLPKLGDVLSQKDLEALGIKLEIYKEQAQEEDVTA